MFFSTAIAGQALLWTVITVAAVFAVRFLVSRKAPSIKLLATVGAGSLVLNSLFTYTALPAHTGSTFGIWWYTLFALAAVGISQFVAYAAADGGRSRYDREPKAANPDASFRPIGRIIAVAVLALFVVPVGQVFLHQWPFGSAKEWADQANITVAANDAQLPQTDNKHIVMVDRNIALFNAQSKLGAGNLGSTYTLDKDDFVKQSIAGHLYWVCPLEYKSGWTQFWAALGGTQKFPGFVIVDAENPDPNNVELVHNLDLHYTNGAMFGHNIIRHLYAAGYTNGNLTAPTIELDDNKKPFITVTYTRPKFTVGGEEMVSVLVVDMKDGSITEYAPDKVPAWVDRIISEDMAESYANNWGYYNDPSTGWLTSAFNGGANQMKVYHTYMAYNSVDAPVYHIAMTANVNDSHSATGVLVYDTRTQKGTFYPGLSGITLDTAVTFKSIGANNNGTGNLEPSEIGLYNVNGRTSFVAIYTSPQNVGRNFAGIGMLDAHNPTSGNVAFGHNKSESLRQYESYLGLNNPNGTKVKDSTAVSKVTGTVEKANWVNGKMYLVLSEDPNHRYAATQDVDGGADLVEVVVGEKISLEYKDFGSREVQVTTVHYDPNQKK